MFCNKCGSQLESGEKFCTRCGTPVQNTQSQPVYNSPASPANNINTMYRTPSLGGSNSSTWLIITLLMSVLLMISLYFSGIGITASSYGQSMSVSLPANTVGSVISQLINAMKSSMGYFGSNAAQQLSAITGPAVWFTIYGIITFITILAFIVTGFMTATKKALGIIIGLGASALAFLGSVVNIIVIFASNSALQSSLSSLMFGIGTVSIYPDLWVWVSLVLSLGTAAVLLLKGKDIISQ